MDGDALAMWKSSASPSLRAARTSTMSGEEKRRRPAPSATPWDGAGDGEFSVALRTGVFDGEIGWVYAGCGIVEGSVADDEYDEIGMKLKTVLSAFDGGEAR